MTKQTFYKNCPKTRKEFIYLVAYDAPKFLLRINFKAKDFIFSSYFR